MKKTHNVEHYMGMTTNIQSKPILNGEKMKECSASHITVRLLHGLHTHHYQKKPQVIVEIKEQEMQNQPPTHPT